MADWITDRRPLMADADPVGNVIVRHDGLTEHPLIKWSFVTDVCHWQHTPDWTPPLPAPPEIPEPIRTGVEPFYVLVVTDDSTKGDGNPIAWETQIPAGSTLDAVLEQQARVGNRYGTTYVAECRIMPKEIPLAIGQTWRCRNGDVCKIPKMTPAHNIWNISHPFWGKCSDGYGHSYTAEGRASANPEYDHPHDLIELLSAAQEAPDA